MDGGFIFACYLMQLVSIILQFIQLEKKIMCPSTIDIDMVCYLKYNFFQCPKNLGCERKLSLFSPEIFFFKCSYHPSRHEYVYTFYRVNKFYMHSCMGKELTLMQVANSKPFVACSIGKAVQLYTIAILLQQLINFNLFTLTVEYFMLVHTIELIY